MKGEIEVRFERLSAAHDRSGFVCEQPSLTDYLLKFAGQNERGDIAACFVAVAPDSAKVVGYYTISAHAVLENELLPEQKKGLPGYDRIPAFLIGRLARDVTMKGKGLGELLLIDALTRLCSIEAAARMIVVDPIDENAGAFYDRYGFTPLGQGTTRLSLPMKVARKAVAALRSGPAS
ncbi:GNAT family N-acetyltransferase [Sphingobium sp. CFD-2]|uniref:GNAT family N-acetyltransferase n=1 Tax=Sphingobium sp. CFD-2 TaxID=2878542 RepID=UPI00214C87AB|nr:GNAT family N-acetyltransferase [Sphingobium sp. CFD-2]